MGVDHQFHFWTSAFTDGSGDFVRLGFTLVGHSTIQVAVVLFLHMWVRIELHALVTRVGNLFRLSLRLIRTNVWVWVSVKSDRLSNRAAK